MITRPFVCSFDALGCQRHGKAPVDFVVLACDGLFDVLEPQPVVDFVWKRLETHGDVERAAGELSKLAIRRYHSTDNVSVIIVVFRRQLERRLRTATGGRSADNGVEWVRGVGMARAGSGSGVGGRRRMGGGSRRGGALSNQ